MTESKPGWTPRRQRGNAVKEGMSILRKLLEPSPDETEKVLAEDAVATVNEATRLVVDIFRKAGEVV